jgi:hypothetical protein
LTIEKKGQKLANIKVRKKRKVKLISEEILLSASACANKPVNKKIVVRG